MPGKYLEWAWHMLGISLACAWNKLGMCLAYAAYSMHTQSTTALQHEKPEKMVKVPSECLTWSIMLGTCLEYAWNSLGMYLEYAWSKLGICFLVHAYSIRHCPATWEPKKMVQVPNVKHYAWHMLGICLAYAWNMFGISLVYAWKVLGISLAYAWNMLGINLACAWNMRGISLACAWHMLLIPCILNQALPCNMKNLRKW